METIIKRIKNIYFIIKEQIKFLVKVFNLIAPALIKTIYKIFNYKNIIRSEINLFNWLTKNRMARSFGILRP